LRSLRLRLGTLLVLGAREQLSLDGAHALLVGGGLLDLRRDECSERRRCQSGHEAGSDDECVALAAKQ
jgi:hypothetical protein